MRRIGLTETTTGIPGAAKRNGVITSCASTAQLSKSSKSSCADRKQADRLRHWTECPAPRPSRYEDGFLQHLYVDHDHSTGKIRGLLCHVCNSAIGLLGDDPDRADAATSYSPQAAALKRKDHCGKCGALKIRAADGKLRCVRCQSEWVRQYYHRNEERRTNQRRSYIKRTYRTTLEHLDDLLRMQHGACAICRVPWQQCKKSNGRYADGTFLQYLNVDHDHETGHIERPSYAALQCSASGRIYDNAENCRRAAAYLRRAREA